MMFIRTFRLNIQIHTSRITERLKKMVEHLGRHIADLLTVESCIPHQPRPSPEIEGDPA